MAEFNQFQLYCAVQTGGEALKDDCTAVKNKIDSMTEYTDVKEFVEKHFEKVKNVGDVEVKEFKNTDKRISCTMLENEAIFFLVKSNSATEPEWTHLSINKT